MVCGAWVRSECSALGGGCEREVGVFNAGVDELVEGGEDGALGFFLGDALLAEDLWLGVIMHVRDDVLLAWLEWMILTEVLCLIADRLHLTLALTWRLFRIH